MKLRLYFIKENCYTENSETICKIDGNSQRSGERTMDEIDKKILSLLVENARITLKQIAAQVFLSPPAVSARIERMERGGVITGYRASVAPEKLGYHIVAFINVVLHPERQRDFYSCVQQSPYVMECYHVAGSFSMLIKACFPDTHRMDSFMARIQKFGETQTQIVFSSVIERREPGLTVPPPAPPQ